jgi:ATP-dependent Lhr-like helicase
VLPAAINSLFSTRSWKPFPFQESAWRAYLEGRSGLINAPTGLGKTWAAWLGPVIEALNEQASPTAINKNVEPAKRLPRSKAAREHLLAEPLRVLWITPLRALAADTTASLLEPARELGLNWTVQMRTGDTPQSVKLRQRDKLPTALVTTPESLTLLLSNPDARERFRTLRLVVADEWHELMGSKRGVQLELALARLRSFTPALRTWGVSATLGNLREAMDVLLGAAPDTQPGLLIRGDEPKKLVIETILPAPPDTGRGGIDRFPWSGHMGLNNLPHVIKAVENASSTLLFTNTRAQAEIWFRRLLLESPDLVGQLAIHHGSLDRNLRSKVEQMLHDGRLKCVVCTSSLDLGVDFSPVDQVLQVGSPKGVARLVQRAGRSGHRPGASSRILGVPAHAFELVEFAAARAAAAKGEIESRTPIRRPLDALVQHLVTIACAGGFVEDELKREVRTTYAFKDLSDYDWSWAMDFVTRGGRALTAYPHFARVRPDPETPGRYVISNPATARIHRMTIGTISAEISMLIKTMSGRVIGHIEEGFIGRLRVGAKFVFAGKVLEIMKIHQMTVFVRTSRNKIGIVPRWDGGRFSLSTQLARSVRELLDDARRGVYTEPEMIAIKPILDLQQRVSRIPAPDELLIESITEAGVHNVFLFLFEGRMVHEGLGALLAYRLGLRAPRTITAAGNDYAIALKSTDPIDLPPEEWHRVLSPEGLIDDLSECLNSSTLARRQFRDIARISGLITPGFPGARNPARHLQASSEMFFDVFEEFDPENLLIDQAKREVLSGQLELGRMRIALDRARASTITVIHPKHLTPLCFPAWAEQLRATTLSSEKWADMVQKMALRLEDRADDDPGVTFEVRIPTRRSRRARPQGSTRARRSLEK